GKALGLNINVVTKTGGDVTHGDLFGYYDDDRLVSANKHEVGPAAPRRYDVGADLGGYLIKSRLWFFAAYNKTRRDVDFARIDSYAPSPAGFQPVYSSTGIDHQKDLFSGKLTLRAGPSHSVSLAVFGDPSQDTGDVIESN